METKLLVRECAWCGPRKNCEKYFKKVFDLSHGMCDTCYRSVRTELESRTNKNKMSPHGDNQQKGSAV